MTRVQDIVPKYDRVYLIGRLTPKYSVTEDIFSCWLWLGTTDSKGYGLIEVGTIGNRRCTIRAHRLSAYLYLNFDLNPDKQICHKCNNPSCINPQHLYIGDNSSNQLDSFRSGKKASIKDRKYCAKGHEFTINTTKLYKTLKICKICDAAKRRLMRLKKKANQCNQNTVQD